MMGHHNEAWGRRSPEGSGEQTAGKSETTHHVVTIPCPHARTFCHWPQDT